MGAETLRTRYLYRTIDAVVTAPLRPRRRAGLEIRSLLSPRSAAYDRVGSLVRLLDRLAPGVARRASRLLCREVELPFAADRVELLAYGSGSTVFLVEGGGVRRALKVYRRSLGADPARLEELRAWYRDKHETMLRWYAPMPELVWPAQFIVLARSPILARPAVACVQPFIDEPVRDLRSFETAELDAILASSPELREQIAHFARITREVWGSQRRCPDLLGECNLAIVGDGDGRRLRLIDYGVFELEPGADDAMRRRVEATIERLGALEGAA